MHYETELLEEMRPADAQVLTDVHVILHQFAEVFCLEELMVLVRMTMAWVFVMKWRKGSINVKCLAPTYDQRKVWYKRTNPTIFLNAGEEMTQDCAGSEGV